MIGLIIWLAICFTWLLYETDWMRVRLDRLSLIQFELLASQRQFLAIPECQRNSPQVDKLRDHYHTLIKEALTLLPHYELPKGFTIGHPSSYLETVSYAIHVLPDTHTPVRAWGKIIGFAELRGYGLEFVGGFLKPMGSPNLVQYACRRDFVIGKPGLTFERS